MDMYRTGGCLLRSKAFCAIALVEWDLGPAANTPRPFIIAANDGGAVLS